MLQKSKNLSFNSFSSRVLPCSNVSVSLFLRVILKALQPLSANYIVTLQQIKIKENERKFR